MKPCLTYNECPNGYWKRGQFVSVWRCKCVPGWWRWFYFKVLHPELRDYF